MLATFVKQVERSGFIVPRQRHRLPKWPRRTFTNGNAYLNGTYGTGGAGRASTHYLREGNSEADESVADGAGSGADSGYPI
jgi:hypothetical protein